MRQLTGFWIALSILLLLSVFAAGQTELILPGAYAEPFVPRLTTPSASFESVMTPTLSLDTPSLQVGATNATEGNVAGAGNATSSVVTTGSPVYYNQPLWYAPGMQWNEAIETSSSEAQATSPMPYENGGLELGAATFQSSYGVAQLMARNARRKATRVYTNPDIARLNDSNGVVRYGAKTARVN